METEADKASGSRTITKAELDALLGAAIAAKREQESAVLTSTMPLQVGHWGNTDYGRIAGAGIFVMLVCVGLAVFCGGVALILAALR